MAFYTQPLRLLPLVLAASLHTPTHAQSSALAMLRPAQQPEAPARGVSLASILQELQTTHHAFFLCRSELIADKFVNIDGLTFRTWEEELTYAVTVSGLRVEKTDRNVYVISSPLKPGTSLQSIGAGAVTTIAGRETAVAAIPDPVTVQGQVTGPDNAPIPGVTVVVKGTTTGTTTDINGKFTLSLPDANATLVISAIGFVGQEISLQGRTQVSVVLATNVKALDEVVVLGYTTQKKSDLTGAVAQINQSDIASIPVGGVAQIMQGKAAGVAITQATGAPGENIAVRIRGVGTINDNNPLYIIDGVPTKDGINQISPNDIESINILKDASSAAIYGARASNGVVVVTTKRGKSGKPRLSVSSYTGVQTPANLIKMANTSQYVTAYNVAAQNDGRDQIPAALASTLPDVNWLKEVLKPAMQYNVQADVSGGGENSQYIVSGSYLKQDGLIQNSSYDRYNLRTAVNSTLSKYFKVGTNANLSYSKTREVGTSGDGFGDGNPGASIVRYALFRTPATPVYNEQGQFVDLPKADGKIASAFFGDGINPVALADAADRNFNRYSLLGNAYVEFYPIERLRIRSDYGVTFLITDYKQFFKTFGIDRSFNSPPQLGQSNTNEFNYNWTNTATYDLLLGASTFNILIGTEAIKNNVRGISASRRGYVDQSATFQYLDSGTGIQQNGGGEAHSSLLSAFGRLGYDYEGKYLASFNFRRDGSSQLSPGLRAQNFYSGSVGWNIAQEEFMRNLSAITLLKLRASVGQLGNSAIGNYPYASLIGGNFYYPFGGTSTQGLSIVTKGNPNVRWETSTQSNVGVDVGLLNGALQLTLDYFIKNTSDVLLFLPQPSSAGGGGNPAVNAGKIRNNGMELELAYRNTVGKDWSYGLSGNFASLNNEVVSLGNAAPIVGGRIDNNYFATLTNVGQPIGSFYLLQKEGIFQNAQEVFTHAFQGPGIKPGDVKYKDISGPDGVPDGIIDGLDRTFVGSPIPKFTYGFTGNVRYKSLDLSAFFQGVQGNKLYNQVNTDIEGFYRAFNITERVATNYWTAEGSTNEFPRLSWTGASNNKQPSDRFLEDGSYLRLKNLQLGYTFGEKLLAPAKISSVRLYASIQNLLTFTNYTGLDPEQGTNSNSLGDGVRATGIDFGTYPSARTFTVGINAGF
ncbi:TonB-dependent receptor [Hymenobacter roseosalivarius DSM 11622]|uniref:TonB-dependent receptor n=1 Tax=Hymenobacter roseosalivarius DSM 11622 TaxID=645990 RepID=A0A1W1VG46_9BACT|nr:TonB-dependent receptor [Hymenobacter roseosalivarius]SMB92338.1 TonB-dependent receptor [Hymenobacter roseosalivarius DSM 11622]